ncbi:putative cystathionine gamma-synthase [Helianthus annuus]|uniref:Cystathionine gamma-synthase n=1 Tax=Helianthus annuus TaxID=4232 RepID=A0A9K3GSC1_HELAN|nr:putative cystathionine gamma-synthase [Helianthus annuus]KAJ0811445.1 putative cystathionine gamma-synthase [Helianthus annuus]
MSQVSLFFTESPTNPFLRCVDIELVSKLCHARGALVYIDGTFATPLKQKALALGADIFVHSATKYLGVHNDVLGGCVSGSTEIASQVRMVHHVLGDTINPNAAYLLHSWHENTKVTYTTVEFHCAEDGRSFRGTS